MRIRAATLTAVVLCAVVGARVIRGKLQEPNEQATGSSKASEPVTIPEEEVARHWTGTHKAVRTKLRDESAFFAGIRLRLVVDEAGNVAAVTAEQGPAEAVPAAVAEARNWKYKPFEKDGEPVIAKITDYVRLLPPEDLPKTHQEFPQLGSPAGVVMTLLRTVCYGTCPSYSVEIHGDGTVLYKGESFVVVAGEHRDHISPEQVDELVDAFRKADYFSLKDEYSYNVTDNPTYTTTFQVDQIKKTVTDYVGELAGMPEAVSDLERTIDRVAGTQKWIQGTADTAPTLKKEGWDFKSEEAAKTMARAAANGSSEFVKDLLKEGTGGTVKDEAGYSALAAAAAAEDSKTLQLLMKAGVGKDDIVAKTRALGAAALKGDLETVEQLIAYGADPKSVSGGEYEGMTVLMAGATSGVPKVVERILSGHPDLNARDEKGRTALWYVCEGNDYWDEKRHANRGEVIHLLARAGADLDAQDEEGNAALHSAYYEGVARALIEDGADVNIRNKVGETPLMSNFSVAAAKLLVAAGADIHAKDDQGKTALDHARELEPEGDRVKYLKALEAAKRERHNE